MNNNDYMSVALEEARLAALENEVPVGCVIVKDNEIIARTHNTRHKNKSAINHAEIMAIDVACKKLNSWQLDGCTLYVTLEPCIMCAGAIIQARIKKVVFAAKEPKFGACGSILNIFDNFEYKFNHEVEVIEGVLEEEAKQLLKDFFKNLRKEK